MQKNKWTKQTLQRLRDRDLRTYADRLFVAINRRIKSRNGHIKDVIRYENDISRNARCIVDRYCELIKGGIPCDMVPNEHANIRELIAHLLKQAHFNVPVHHEASPILEETISDYNRK